MSSYSIHQLHCVHLSTYIILIRILFVQMGLLSLGASERGLVQECPHLHAQKRKLIIILLYPITTNVEMFVINIFAVDGGCEN